MFIELEMENKTRRFVSGRQPSVDNKISVFRFLMKLPFFQRLPEYEKDNILQKNVSVGVLFQKCTFFNPSKSISFESLVSIFLAQVTTWISSSKLCLARERSRSSKES